MDEGEKAGKKSRKNTFCVCLESGAVWMCTKWKMKKCASNETWNVLRNQGCSRQRWIGAISKLPSSFSSLQYLHNQQTREFLFMFTFFSLSFWPNVIWDFIILMKYFLYVLRWNCCCPCGLPIKPSDPFTCECVVSLAFDARPPK